MPIKASEIEGFDNEIDDLIEHYLNEISVEKLSGNVVKEELARGTVLGLRLSKMGERELTLNRERLADILFDNLPKSWFVELDFIEQEELIIRKVTRMKEMLLETAEAIIAQEHTILEVKK